MRNLKLIDAVISLKDIAKLIQEEISDDACADFLSEQINICADELHQYSIKEDHASSITNNLILHLNQK